MIIFILINIKIFKLDLFKYNKYFIYLLIFTFIIYNVIFYINMGLVIKTAINWPAAYCYFYKFGKNLIIGNTEDNE